MITLRTMSIDRFIFNTYIKFYSTKLHCHLKTKQLNEIVHLKNNINLHKTWSTIFVCYLTWKPNKETLKPQSVNNTIDYKRHVSFTDKFYQQIIFLYCT